MRLNHFGYATGILVAWLGVSYALAQTPSGQTDPAGTPPVATAPATAAPAAPATATPATATPAAPAAKPAVAPAKSPTVVPEGQSTADHSKFEALKGPFASGPDVTKACISCHTEADDQMMHSVHWTWEKTVESTGQVLGKKNVVNSFCGNVASNETRCTSCHAGYGWEDVRQPINMDGSRVDCLACHDRSGQYTKLDNKAGHPPLDPVPEKAKTITGAAAWAVDLAKSAQSVGMPGRDNCGNCHFYGGGGDNVKHGDLSSALISPALSTDVHMSPEGENFTCESCHISDKHVFAGSRYEVNAHDLGGIGKPGERRDVASCESCHSDNPHGASLIGMKLNDHVERIACQTCHIPEFAKGGVATKTLWDWSTAGKLDAAGKPITEEGFTQSNGKHLHTYLSTKGNFEWEENVVPYYAWFDGQIEYTLPGEKIDPTQTVEVNKISGSASDPASRIWPFKRMKGAQAYDKQLNTLAFNHVYGPKTTTAFWTNFDYEKSIKAAMDYVGRPYSGEFGFVKTDMYWPIAHMVAPADEALKCDSCHAADGRLAGVAGVYMPGTGLPLGGVLGLLMLGAAVIGVSGHGLLRVLRRGVNKGGENHG